MYLNKAQGRLESSSQDTPRPESNSNKYVNTSIIQGIIQGYKSNLPPCTRRARVEKLNVSLRMYAAMMTSTDWAQADDGI